MSRPFLETLGALRKGKTLEELADELASLVGAVQAANKGGSLTLKLTVSPPKKGGAVYLVVSDEIITKLPKVDRAETVFFPTKDNGLSRQDPSQIDLPLRGLSPNGPVDLSTGEITEGLQS